MVFFTVDHQYLIFESAVQLDVYLPTLCVTLAIQTSWFPPSQAHIHHDNPSLFNSPCKPQQTVRTPSTSPTLSTYVFSAYGALGVELVTSTSIMSKTLDICTTTTTVPGNDGKSNLPPNVTAL